MATEPEGDYSKSNSHLLRVTLSGVLVVVAFWLLLIGQSLLIPLVLAIFIWYLIEALKVFGSACGSLAARSREWCLRCSPHWWSS